MKVVIGEDEAMGKDDGGKDDGGKHEDEEEKRRQGDGQPTRPIDPELPREPKPGKRGE